MGSQRKQSPRGSAPKHAHSEKSAAVRQVPSHVKPGGAPQGLEAFRSNRPDDIPLTREGIPLLQRFIGSRAVSRIIQAKLKAALLGDETGRRRSPATQQAEPTPYPARLGAEASTPQVSAVPIQRQPAEEEEASESQEEDGDVVQAKRSSPPSAVMEPARNDEEEEERKKRSGGGGPLQKKSAAGEAPAHAVGAAGESDNRGGLPAPLRAGLETLSGKDLSGIRVHYNASEPARLNALAYTRGQDIHISPGQEKHLPHEGWHAVQQMQGRVKTTLKAMGEPINDDGSLEREADVMGAKALQMATAPTGLPAAGRLASTHAASFAMQHGRPGPAPGAPIQRTTSNGITVKDMKFAPNDIPADGAATSQGSVHYSGRLTSGAKINWSIVGAAFGSSIDATGKVTAGAALPAGKEKEQLKVKAEDSAHAGAHTFGLLNLWDKEFFQAKLDFPKFIALPTMKIDPFTPGTFGKFLITYTPKTRRLDATVRVKFIFVNLPGAANWNNKSKAAYEGKFISLTQSMWSNQYQFANVREPKKIWKKLNPVRVRVMVKRDKTGAPDQTITVHKKKVGGATGVGGVRGQVRLGKGHDAGLQPGFNPAAGAGELARLGALTPTPILFAAGRSDINAVDRPKLEFMATYLHRIKDPPFRIAITGHHQQVVHPPGATAAQKSAALKQAKQLSRQRADEVLSVLRAGSATAFHKVTRTGVGDAGAAATPAWDKVEIASALPPGWQNIRSTFAHEFGHMLGIGDEYATGTKPAGTPTTHYNLTKKAFGQAYADAQAKRIGFGTSVMAHGHDVRPHHYVTFWDGLAQMTSAAAFPKRPFAHADWTFVGQ